MDENCWETQVGPLLGIPPDDEDDHHHHHHQTPMDLMAFNLNPHHHHHHHPDNNNDDSTANNNLGVVVDGGGGGMNLDLSLGTSGGGGGGGGVEEGVVVHSQIQHQQRQDLGGSNNVVHHRQGDVEQELGRNDMRSHHHHHLGHRDDGRQQQDSYFAHQLLVSSGQTTTGNNAGSPASHGGSLSPGGSATGVPGALSPGGTSSSGGPTTQCCESGRPLVTDPVTGQSVCSCQYDQARLAALQYPRGVGVYGAPYPSTDQNPYPSIGVESSAFYSPLGNPYALKDASGTADMSAWTSAGLQPTTGYYPYDPTLAAYGYGAGYDLAARRKNATRESTATLKAWLNEHKKNPYPTKGEKIMLAIITKMTLTQVSTWFANARRRLKKENKMTWEPKNKTDDDDDALVSDGEDKDKDEEDKRDETDIHGRIKSERSSSKDLDDDDDMSDDRKDDLLGPSMHHLLGPAFGTLKPEQLKSSSSSDCGVPLPPSKPKIWSLADTAACKTPPPPPPSSHHPHQSALHHQHHQHYQQHHHHHHQWLAAAGGGNGFALPSNRYGGFLPSHCQQQQGGGGGGSGFPEVVQTDTPPQTPPSMKLPSVAGNLLPGGGQGQGQGQGSGGYGHGNGFLGGFGGRLQSPQRGGGSNSNQGNQMGGPTTGGGGADSAAAFKPFYKSSQSMNGGFVSPV